MQANLLWQKTGQLLPEGVEEKKKNRKEGLQRDRKKLSGVVSMSTILNMVLVSRAYIKYIYNTYKIKLYTLNTCSLLYVNYTLIKLF